MAREEGRKTERDAKEKHQLVIPGLEKTREIVRVIMHPYYCLKNISTLPKLVNIILYLPYILLHTYHQSNALN